MSESNGQGAKGIIVTLEEFNLRKVTKAELHQQATQQADKARELSQKLQEAYTEIALLKEQDQAPALKQRITELEAANTELMGKVRQLEPVAKSVTMMAQDNHRLALTLDKVATMGEALVPKPQVNLTPRS